MTIRHSLSMTNLSRGIMLTRRLDVRHCLRSRKSWLSPSKGLLCKSMSCLQVELCSFCKDGGMTYDGCCADDEEEDDDDDFLDEYLADKAGE